MPRLCLRPVAWLFTLALGLLGCSDDESAGDGGGQDAGDGKVHPAPNGTHITEAAACEALKDAQDAQAQAVGCIITTASCPDRLVVEFGTACMEYDQGSVQGCADYYQQAADCDALKAAVEICVVTPYPGTEPAGCP